MLNTVPRHSVRTVSIFCLVIIEIWYGDRNLIGNLIWLLNGSFRNQILFHITYDLILSSYVTPWCGVLPEKPTVIQLVKKEIPRLLWNPNFHYRVYMRSPLVSILSQMNPVQTFPSYFPKIHLILSSHLRLGLPSGLFPSGLPTKFCMRFWSHSCVLHTPPISFSLIWPP